LVAETPGRGVFVMESFVVRLDEPDLFNSILSAWMDMGCDFHEIPTGSVAPPMGTEFPRPTLAARIDILGTWNLGTTRLRWLYYCDDNNGISLRLYDTEHFTQYATNGYYIQPPGDDPNDHYERVIVRGYSMGSALGPWEPGLVTNRILHQHLVGGNLREDIEQISRASVATQLKLRMRAGSKWLIWKATEAPYNENNATSPPGTALSCPINLHNPASLDTRLAYFEHPERNNMSDYLWDLIS
jgi:hypothetical protein